MADAADLVEKLIEEVKKNAPLFDNSLYKDALKKRDIWNTIGSRLGISGENGRKKWMNVRDAYQLSRKKNISKSGDPAKNIKPYKYAGILEFMIPHLQYRETTGNLPEEGEEADEGVSEQMLQGKERAVPEMSTPAPYSRKRSSSGQSAFDKAIVDYLEGRKKEEDDLDLFFKSMATRMRKMPLHIRCKLKFRIHEMVHRAEMETMFTSSQATVWNGSMEYNCL
ncbi:uncharacterized protein LOC121708387 [Alosa sapidissima]|uniref:uncharacterized protein LOC121708387 n=1 Tax=Alosa sapidissima TaxID=34773 RepID=UPI001C086551|nr:uncharacterized protein LOC121708387 [Alosa sapidissima]